MSTAIQPIAIVSGAVTPIAAQVNADPISAIPVTSTTQISSTVSGGGLMPGETVAPFGAPSGTYGLLSSTGDLQVLQSDGGYLDVGVIPQAILSAAGISLSDSQYLTSAQVAGIQAAQGVAATSGVTVSTASPCGIALFGDTACYSIGSVTIGQTTMIIFGAAAILAIFLFGGKK
jgi:hypothetical protein